MVKHWKADPIWTGERCFIVAGGPSLAGFDFEALRGKKVIAINASIWCVPFADFGFYADTRFALEHRAKIRAHPGAIVTTSESYADPNLLVMGKIRPPPALATERTQLVMDRTSLHASINLAVHFGVSEIVLMGADMQAAPNGVTHHHEPHPWPSIKGCWDEQMKQLCFLPPALNALGVKVINTSLKSRLPWWPKQPIEELL